LNLRQSNRKKIPKGINWRGGGASLTFEKPARSVFVIICVASGSVWFTNGVMCFIAKQQVWYKASEDSMKPDIPLSEKR